MSFGLAAAQIPMMRELKGEIRQEHREHSHIAAAQIPMMRELKVRPCLFLHPLTARCSPNPYDEGTERLLLIMLRLLTSPAAAQIPMMRELKDSFWGNCDTQQRSCSPNPYDEGTESFKVQSINRKEDTLQPKSL